MAPLLQKHMPLHSNTSRSSELAAERKKDHYSHFILRLAFSQTEELRRRYSRLETMLFQLRYKSDDSRERNAFIKSLNFDWEVLSAEEEEELRDDLRAATYVGKDEEQGWFKVEWERVPDLVGQRKVMLKRGMAYVPLREQMSLVIAEFTKRLDKALEVTARAIPRLDEDDRLSPILAHLSKSFTAPDSTYDDENANISSSLQPTAQNIDALSKHFPLCMQNLHMELRKNSHLKHYGRLQYTLFLKGLGLTLEDCIMFWRRSFKLMTDEKFDKEYKYNVRHAYGDVGGDANRRGRGYTPYSCQKLTTEALPGSGQSHGCPYRTYNPDNLVALLQNVGLSDREVLKGVREDVGRQRYHVACNRVFDHVHKREIKEVKDGGMWPASELDTIVHPNTYFKRSFLLKHLGEDTGGGGGPVKKEDESMTDV